MEEQLLRLLLLVVIVVTRAEGSEPEHVYIPDNIDDADSEPSLPDGFDLGSMGSLRGHWFKDPAIQVCEPRRYPPFKLLTFRSTSATLFCIIFPTSIIGIAANAFLRFSSR